MIACLNNNLQPKERNKREHRSEIRRNNTNCFITNIPQEA